MLDKILLNTAWGFYIALHYTICFVDIQVYMYLSTLSVMYVVRLGLQHRHAITECFTSNL